jgi:3-phosphoshikimate 1-carboxyvinyltransferase
MTTLKIEPGLMPDRIQIPGSKSYANRALILAAVKKSTVTLTQLPEASDVTFLLQALRSVGLRLEESPGQVSVVNSFPACESEVGATIAVGEGGTTARFLACLLLTGKAPYELILGQRLKDRPWGEFLQLVNSLGAKASLEGDRLRLQGPIKVTSELKVTAKETTQYASGFQLVLAFTPTKVIPVGLESSQSYWAMTEEMVKHFQQADCYQVPADWSSASYPLAFCALKRSAFFPGLKRDHTQADDKFCDLLERLGCVVYRDDGIQVDPIKRSENISLDVSDCLDLVPTLAYFLSHLDGRHELRGFENLVHKESNRLHEVLKILNSFGISSEVKNEVWTIQGNKNLTVPFHRLALPNDHRLVMTAALFMMHHQGGELSPTEAVEKSYPDFWKLIKTLPIK